MWRGDLVDMQLISKNIKRLGFVLCTFSIILVFSCIMYFYYYDTLIKFAWDVPLKEKKGITKLINFKRF